jgi:hypothetical protein
MAFDLNSSLEAAKPIVAFLKPFIPPFVGSMFGYLLEKEEGRGKRVLAFAVGFSVAVYGSELLSAYFSIVDVKIVGGIAFALGMFGKTLVSAAFTQVPVVIAGLGERLVGLFPGGKK